MFFDWAYNLRPYSYSSMGVSAVRRADEYSYLLPYVFYSPSYEEKGAFNVINKQTVAGDVSSSVIRDYILNYGSSNFVSWHTSRNLPSELFVNEVDSARAEKGIKVGLNKVRTNLSDTFDLKSWNSEYGRWWDKLVQYGWSYPKNDALGDDHVGVKPFEEITAEKLLSGNLSRDLLINEQDVDVFKKFCNDSLNKTQKKYRICSGLPCLTIIHARLRDILPAIIYLQTVVIPIHILLRKPCFSTLISSR